MAFRAGTRPVWCRAFALPAVRLAVAAVAAACGAALAAAAAVDLYVDPLDAAAPRLQATAGTPLLAIDHAGARFVAAGLHGQVLTSDDGGMTWQQANVPLSTELVSVRFIDARHGWITGHGGVILHSVDGGSSWARQLDGRQAAALLTAHFQPLADAGSKSAAFYLEQVRLDFANGPEQPLLDVWFDDERTGFACGPFGLLLATSDGGATWQSWMEKVDNPEFRHLFSLQRIGGVLYMSSEQGKVFRFDDEAQRFVASDTGYRGSLFGLVGGRDYVIAYGLEGSAYRSRDGGRRWERLATGLRAGITGAALLDDRRLLLVTQGGDLRISADQGSSFTTVGGHRPVPFAAVAAANGAVVGVGPSGLQRLMLKP